MDLLDVPTQTIRWCVQIGTSALGNALLDYSRLTPGYGQATPTRALGTDFQSWDELNVFTRIRRNLDITWIARLRFSEELPNPAHLVFGTDWNFSLGKHLVFTPSYYYGTYHTESGATGHRQVSIFAVMPTLSRGNWTVSDRNRFGGKLTLSQPSHLGSIEIVQESTIDSAIPALCRPFLCGTRSTISRSTGDGRGTGSRLGHAGNSVNGLRPTFTINGKTTAPAASRHMSTRSRC